MIAPLGPARPSDRRAERVSTPSAVRPTVLVGAVALLGDDGRLSAIDKRPAPAPWRIGPLGLAGDAQADLKHHGGPEKALHHYPFDHYAAWAGEIGDDALLRQPGAFGENLATTGWTEANVCVGDIVRFGSALLQVSQGRQPCWKLNRRFSRKDMAARVQSSGRAGWYYRVLEPGMAEPGDELRVVDRPCPQWSLERLFRLLHRDTGDRDGLAGMTALAELAENWRDLAKRRLSSGKIEDWRQRLYGEIVPGGAKPPP
jgi:MOSC domain-containing protein YiiM